MRLAGYAPVQALRNAKIVQEFEIAERAGLVRLVAEAEEENYFNVYGEPEGYLNAQGNWVTPEQERENIAEIIERDGCWIVLSEYWGDGKWVYADSVGMCVYSNPRSAFENCYVPDLMQAALEGIGQPGEVDSLSEAEHNAFPNGRWA